MQEARILHIEDDEDMRNTIELMLSVRGVHRVVAWAESLPQAYERLEEIKNKRSDANTILLDGHLKGGAGMNHPRNVINKMKKELELNLPIIGLSLDGLAERGIKLGIDVDFDLTKEVLGKDIRLLDHILDELPEPEV